MQFCLLHMLETNVIFIFHHAKGKIRLQDTFKPGQENLEQLLNNEQIFQTEYRKRSAHSMLEIIPIITFCSYNKIYNSPEETIIEVFIIHFEPTFPIKRSY